MKWKQVESILRKEVVSRMRYPKKGDEWLSAIPKCIDGQLLAVCMTIDVKSGAVDPQEFASILDALKPPFKDARRSFGLYVRKYGHRYIGSTNFVSHTLPRDDSYMRIMEMKDFIDFYVTPTMKMTSNARDIHKIRAMFFRKGGQFPLGCITEWTTGKTGRVWVTSRKRYRKLAAARRKEDDRATDVNDALGLGYRRGVHKNTPPEMVALIYPYGLGVGVYQPTTLDASWANPGNWFVAFCDHDTWGRTHSVSGTLKPMTERIHSGFKGLTNDYKTERIGEARLAVENRAAQLAEACRRLDRVIKKLPPFP